jgi:type II secretory pathway pseudopilin PulG
MVELLVSVTIIIILAGLAYGGVGKAISMAHKAREINAGRNLITAYLNYAADNNGQYMPGMDYTVNQLTKPNGERITMAHTCQRYAFRLAPYFNYDIDNILLAGNNGEAIKKINHGSTSGSMYDYLVSVFPSFGMNIYFVGGQIDAMGRNAYPNDCAGTQAYAASILVFATAGTTDGNIRVEGFNLLTPPNLTVSCWSGVKWKTGIDPGSFGNVDARYNGKALCVFLDGSVRELTISELRDMQLWNKNAAEQQDPDYMVR